ncbi:MAG: ABC transporter ATP-binding protein [Deltaproteobacteria bacterium]|nr:ABC transporter ATP-binding protein [Deltaproteobacteria bacterium]MBN2671033.1 ABC transporter ATP-binding protein [Deltaproteobacteria bacterium]
MIELISISVELGGKTILKDFSLGVGKGRKVAVFGESGAGKSTLLKTLIGMYVPVKGEIRFNDKPFVPEYMPEIRRQVFYLPQDVVPQGEETVEDFLMYPFGLHVNKSMSYSRDKTVQLFSSLRLPSDLLNQPLYKLSGGERKRVGLLQGLLLERSILLADEPTAGVDAANRDEIIQLLFNESDTTVIAVTHDESMIERSDVKVEMKHVNPPGEVA